MAGVAVGHGTSMPGLTYLEGRSLHGGLGLQILTHPHKVSQCLGR